MKKYVVRNKTTNEVFGKFDTKKEAGEYLLSHLKNHLSDVRTTEFLSPFDFEMLEEEIQEIVSYEDAKKYLGLSDEPLMTICGVTKHHEKALLALSKLFTIAEAWNKEDRFVSDFFNENQYKYFPWFKYIKDAAGLVCAGANWTTTTASMSIGPRLCFATRERAFDFGKQFVSLYNDFLMIK